MLLRDIFSLVGNDFKRNRYFNIEGEKLDWHFYFTHNVSFYLSLFFSILVFTDIFYNDAIFIKPFLLGTSWWDLSIVNLKEESTSVIFYLSIPFSLLVSLAGVLLFFLMQKSPGYINKKITTNINKNILIKILYFFIGIIYILVLTAGAVILILKIMGSLSSVQVWWLSSLQIIVIAKYFAILSGMLSGNFVHFLVSFESFAKLTRINKN